VGGEPGADDQHVPRRAGVAAAGRGRAGVRARGSAATSAARGCRRRGTSRSGARRRRGRGRGRCGRPAGVGHHRLDRVGELGRARGRVGRLVVALRGSRRSRTPAGPVSVAPSMSGAASQCAETIRIRARRAAGRRPGRRAARSSVASSTSGGAPWLMNSAGIRPTEVQLSAAQPGAAAEVEAVPAQRQQEQWPRHPQRVDGQQRAAVQRPTVAGGHGQHRAEDGAGAEAGQAVHRAEAVHGAVVRCARRSAPAPAAPPQREAPTEDLHHPEHDDEPARPPGSARRGAEEQPAGQGGAHAQGHQRDGQPG
jgi:hypothetical protein